MATVRDDADLAAVELTRRALAAWQAGGQRHDELLDEVLTGVWEQHGCAGVTALVLSLARHCAAAVALFADARGESAQELLDEAERVELVEIVRAAEAGAGS